MGDWRYWAWLAGGIVGYVAIYDVWAIRSDRRTLSAMSASLSPATQRVALRGWVALGNHLFPYGRSDV